jgi:hypothetical protein
LIVEADEARGASDLVGGGVSDETDAVDVAAVGYGRARVGKLSAWELAGIELQIYEVRACCDGGDEIRGVDRDVVRETVCVRGAAKARVMVRSAEVCARRRRRLRFLVMAKVVFMSESSVVGG